MRLRQIEVLHALLVTGSVSDAARMLHVTQPAVSKVLQHTEQQLGFALFDRERGRLRPTEEALALWAEIEKVIPQVDAVKRLAANLRSGAGQALRVVTLPSLAQALLPAAIAGFRRDRPGLSMELRAQHTRELVTALVLRDAEVGFDFGGVNHPAVSRHRLATTEFICVAPDGWFPRGQALTSRMLRERPAIHMAASDPLFDLLVASGAVETAAPKLVAQTNHAAVALAAEGLGYALVDPFTALSCRSERIALHRLHPPIELGLDRLSPANRPISSLTGALAQAVQRAANRALERLA